MKYCNCKKLCKCFQLDDYFYYYPDPRHVSPPAGYPVRQPRQEVLGSQPTLSQQRRRVRPSPCKPHQCYLSGCQKKLPLPPSCLLHSPTTPAAPVYPLCPQCRLHRAVVRSSSQHVEPAASTNPASLGQRLPASGDLSPSTGPTTRTRPLPAHCHSAEVSEQPRGVKLEDNVGAGARAGFTDGQPSRGGEGWLVLQREEKEMHWSGENI